MEPNEQQISHKTVKHDREVWVLKVTNDTHTFRVCNLKQVAFNFSFFS